MMKQAGRDPQLLEILEESSTVAFRASRSSPLTGNGCRAVPPCAFGRGTLAASR